MVSEGQVSRGRYRGVLEMEGVARVTIFIATAT